MISVLTLKVFDPEALLIHPAFKRNALFIWKIDGTIIKVTHPKVFESEKREITGRLKVYTAKELNISSDAEIQSFNTQKQQWSLFQFNLLGQQFDTTWNQPV